MSGSVHKDNLTFGEIAFIFKGTSSIMCAPDRARITCVMFKYGVMQVKSGIFTILILEENS